MKVLHSLFLLIWLPLVTKQILAASNCSKLPDVVEDGECCSAPDITDRVLLKQCEDEGANRLIINGTLACFVTECYFERVGLLENNQISLNKVKRYMELQEHLVDPVWREAFKDAAIVCFQRTYNKDVDEIREQIGYVLDIDLTVCDPSYIFYTTCIQAEIVKKCPKKAFRETPPCYSIQAFLHDCPDYLTTATQWVAQSNN